jgi:ribosome-associated translation inhibitor RaiA
MSENAVERSDVVGEQVPIEVSTSGPVSNGQRRAIEAMVDKLIQSVEDRVVRARIRAEQHPEHSKSSPVTVRVVLEIKGGPVRAHVETATFHEAIDAAEHRLRQQLRHRAERRQSTLHRGPASPDGEWRHGDLGSERPPYFPRPVDDRRIVRHKSFAPAASTVEEAVFDLESMSYDFFLFIEETSDDDALVAKQDDGRFSVHFRRGPVNSAVPETAGMIVDQHQAPELDIATAEERLDAGHEPWVFFNDAETGRGHVLYRRYDGHYGLIVPLDEPD